MSVVTICIDPEKPVFERFVSSLRQYTKSSYEMIIVNNGGTDGKAAKRLKKEADKYIQLKKRLSVAEAWNLGIRQSASQYVLITNDDVVVPKDWYEQMREAFEIFPNVGSVAPVMNYGLAEQTHVGTIWQKKIACPVMLTSFKQIIWGVFCLFKREALDKVGLFSEEYPLAGGEDLDMCFKLYSEGFNIVVDHRVFVYHEWGSTGKRLYGSAKREAIYKKNFAKFKKKWSRYTKDWD